MNLSEFLTRPMKHLKNLSITEINCSEFNEFNFLDYFTIFIVLIIVSYFTFAMLSSSYAYINNTTAMSKSTLISSKYIKH